jgi:hypothetical protein
MTIPLVFFVLFVLTLWFVIGSRGHWALKAVVIAATLHLCVSVGISLGSFAGWPSSDRLPDKFLIHWVVIKEPSKKTKEPGAIYVWLTSMTDPKRDTSSSEWRRFFITLSPDGNGQPRSHILPYSKGKHKEADDIIQLLKDGKAVVGERGKGGKRGDGEGDGGKGGGDSKNGENGGGSFSRSDGITFHELPPTRLPKKAGGSQ